VNLARKDLLLKEPVAGDKEEVPLGGDVSIDIGATMTYE